MCIRDRDSFWSKLANAYFKGKKNITRSTAFPSITVGLIVLRYLFGLTGDVLIEGVVASDATRIEASDIESYLESLML